MARENRVEMSVLRDGFERDVRHAFENETAFDTFVVLEAIMIELRGQQALARNRKRHARRIASNPASSPLLGDYRCHKSDRVLNRPDRLSLRYSGQ